MSTFERFPCLLVYEAEESNYFKGRTQYVRVSPMCPNCHTQATPWFLNRGGVKEQPALSICPGCNAEIHFLVPELYGDQVLAWVRPGITTPTKDVESTPPSGPSAPSTAPGSPIAPTSAAPASSPIPSTTDNDSPDTVDLAGDKLAPPQAFQDSSPPPPVEP